MLILNTIDASIQNDKRVYIHCWGGVGRTGMAVGCYLIRHGISREQALLRVATLYKTTTSKIHILLRSPETDEQIEFVLNWWDEPHITKSKFCVRMNWHTRYLQQAAWTRDLRTYLFEQAGLVNARRVLEVGCGTGAILRDLTLPPRFTVWTLNLLRSPSAESTPQQFR